MINHLKNVAEFNAPVNDTQEKGIAMVDELISEYIDATDLSKHFLSEQEQK